MDASREQPEEEALLVEAEKPGHSESQPTRVGLQSLITVEHVLERVVGRITDVRLGIDDEPRFSYRRQDVPGVEVGAQQHLTFGGGGQGAEQFDAFPSEARVEIPASGRDLLRELVGPLLAHVL